VTATTRNVPAVTVRAPGATQALRAHQRALVHACYSLGWAPGNTLHALCGPASSSPSFWRTLTRLHDAGFLDRQRTVGFCTRPINLYGVGRAGLAVGQPRPWRPRPAQLEHTLAIGEVLGLLARPGRYDWLLVTGWQGEAELRDWAARGDPYPDLLVNWRVDGDAGSWCVEVDRGTESGPAWRRKLVRYLRARPTATILAITTSAARARNLAQLGVDAGVHVQALALTELIAGDPPEVYDSRTRTRLSLPAGCAQSV